MLTIHPIQPNTIHPPNPSSILLNLPLPRLLHIREAIPHLLEHREFLLSNLGVCFSSKRVYRIDRIGDFSAVHIQVLDALKGIFKVDGYHRGVEFAETLLPECLADILLGLAEAEEEVNTGLYGNVEVVAAVSGQENDTLEVLQLAEEDGNDAVVFEVASLARVAGFEENIGFVNQDDGFPECGKSKVIFELGVDVV